MRAYGNEYDHPAMNSASAAVKSQPSLSLVLKKLAEQQEVLHTLVGTSNLNREALLGQRPDVSDDRGGLDRATPGGMIEALSDQVDTNTALIFQALREAEQIRNIITG